MTRKQQWTMGTRPKGDVFERNGFFRHILSGNDFVTIQSAEVDYWECVAMELDCDVSDLSWQSEADKIAERIHAGFCN